MCTVRRDRVGFDPPELRAGEDCTRRLELEDDDGARPELGRELELRLEPEWRTWLRVVFNLPAYAALDPVSVMAPTAIASIHLVHRIGLQHARSG